jgi:hypothetical protein
VMRSEKRYALVALEAEVPGLGVAIHVEGGVPHLVLRSA